MIRILQSVSYMDRAGVETMLMNYYRHIDRSLFQFDFLCNRDKPGAYDEEILDLGGRIFRTPGINPFHYGRYLAYMHELFAAHPEYQILHAHNSSLGAFPLYAAKREHIPHRIAHVHSASFNVDYKLPVKLVCRPLLPVCANHLWGCGEKAVTFYYGARRVSQGQTRVINNAIEIERFLFDVQKREAMRRQFGLQDKFVIGHAGRFVPQKNHFFLLQVFEEIYRRDNNAVLILLGDGDLRAEVENRVKQQGLQNAVRLLGNVGNASDWYQAMDAFVLPSVWEGLPVTGIEAQTADLPCFFSADITREVDLLQTTRFLSRKESPSVWVEAILAARGQHGRTSRRETMQSAGFDIAAEAVKLCRLYEDMTAGKTII